MRRALEVPPETPKTKFPTMILQMMLLSAVREIQVAEKQPTEKIIIILVPHICIY